MSQAAAPPPLHASAPPLSADGDGTVRVAGTRVPLETVIVAFEQGSTPEEIHLQFPSLELADIYAVIAYYLGNLDEIAPYLAERSEGRERVRSNNETRCDLADVRARLQARGKTQG